MVPYRTAHPSGVNSEIATVRKSSPRSGRGNLLLLLTLSITGCGGETAGVSDEKQLRAIIDRHIPTGSTREEVEEFLTDEGYDCSYHEGAWITGRPDQAFVLAMALPDLVGPEEAYIYFYLDPHGKLEEYEIFFGHTVP